MTFLMFKVAIGRAYCIPTWKDKEKTIENKAPKTLPEGYDSVYFDDD